MAWNGLVGKPFIQFNLGGLFCDKLLLIELISQLNHNCEGSNKKSPRKKKTPDSKPNPIGNLPLTPHGGLFSGGFFPDTTERFLWNKMRGKTPSWSFWFPKNSEIHYIKYTHIGNHVNKRIIIRSSQRRCSIKKVFLEILQNSQENTCARDSFLIKLQAKILISFPKSL